MKALCHEMFVFFCIIRYWILLKIIPTDNRLISLKDKYKGKRCFIVGLGPSLSSTDLDILHDNEEICFSMNKVYRMFDKTNWRPNYYFISDKNAADYDTRDNIDFMLKNGIEVIYSLFDIKKMPSQAIPFKSNFLRKIYSYSRIKPIAKKSGCCLFSQDASKYLYDGESCVCSILQLVYYLGFSEVYLLGCDCGTMGNQSYCVELNASFNNVYLTGMTSLIRDYKSILDDIRNKNIPLKIYNATRGGYLDVFPRVNFDQLFTQK